MSVHQVHVFISHSWRYSHHYETLADWIFGRNWRSGQARILFRDYSVPSSDPFIGWYSDKKLRELIYNQIRRSHVVVIPTGMYAEYSKWIAKEIDGAASYSKPILAVDPWGARRTSQTVAEAAALCVGWSSKSVVQGVWDLYYRS